MSEGILLRRGDCLRVFGAETDGSFDAFVSDPPAGIGFMGRTWDKDRGGRARWVEFWAKRFALARQKTKPGGWSLTWALPRTAHWTGCAIEDAGWTIVDSIHHVFGQGWPKGRAQLKPAHEVWFLARNAGGAELQIDAARVPRGARPEMAHNARAARSNGCAGDSTGSSATGALTTLGSWPPNFVLSHTPGCDPDGPCDEGCPVAALDRQSGVLKSGVVAPWQTRRGPKGWSGGFADDHGGPAARGVYGGTVGGASRFFPGFYYFAKAAGGERDAGCDGLYWQRNPENPFGFDRISREAWGKAPAEAVLTQVESLQGQRERARARGNVHPTVKRLALMEWLCSLVAKPGDQIGDLTLGSGGTAIAWWLVNARAGTEARFLGAETCPEALAIAKARLRWWKREGIDAKPKRSREGVVVNTARAA